MEPISSEKSLKSQVGCHVHVHLLNNYIKLDPACNALYFLECFELSGAV
jgi:hypothetical protein